MQYFYIDCKQNKYLIVPTEKYKGVCVCSIDIGIMHECSWNVNNFCIILIRDND